MSVMKKLILFCLFALSATLGYAQGSVRGKVVDTTTGESMPYVNVAVYDKATQKFIKGAISDEKGLFNISGLAYGRYDVKLSYIGFTTLEMGFAVDEAPTTQRPLSWTASPATSAHPAAPRLLPPSPRSWAARQALWKRRLWSSARAIPSTASPAMTTRASRPVPLLRPCTAAPRPVPSPASAWATAPRCPPDPEDFQDPYQRKGGNKNADHSQKRVPKHFIHRDTAENSCKHDGPQCKVPHQRPPPEPLG